MTPTFPLPADDATATYRGYRRQSLYALSRVFDDSLPAGVTIQPEGVEDVAIYGQDGALIEIVQVKDHTANLTPSSFKPIFYKRIANHCRTGSTTAVTIASYGPIGPEFKKAISGNNTVRLKVVNTIAKEGVSKSQALAIIDHIQIQEVIEEDLVKRLTDILKKTVTGADPTAALDYLIWWMVTSSEGQHVIDRSVAIDKIYNIGRFLTARADHHDEWNTSILPLTDTEGRIDKSALAQEFYRGGRVRFDHIAAGVDIPRSNFLKEIHESFDRSNVVVVHSASGQGKTTISYRYLKEFAPSEFRFEALPADSLSHARKMAQALTGHSAAVEAPTLVFVDVRPGDMGWVEMVKGLSAADGIRVLVAIREEDWRRSNVTITDFAYQEVELEFREEEARAIYDVLPSATSSERHLDFADAWSQFGGRKTLIEFVYFVTQEESLSDRVKGQVRTLLDDANAGRRSDGEIRFLRAVAVASAFEARLDLARLKAACAIPAPTRTIDLFEKEYLIRVSEDGCHIEGFHAIRSEILCAELCDPVIEPWHETATLCLRLLVEEDLERFLLCAFSRQPKVTSNILAALDEFQPKTWEGLCGIFRAVLWQGLLRYVHENALLIEAARQKFQSGWQIILDWNLAQPRGADGLISVDRLGSLSDAAANSAREFREQQSNKQLVFEPLKGWLSQRKKAPDPPSCAGDWMGMAEAMFWIGHLDIETPLREWLPQDDILRAIEELPTYRVGDFVRGIRECHPDWYAQWLSKHRGELEERIRREATIVNLTEDADSIVAHYVIDLDQNASILRRNAQGDAVSEATVHELTMERVRLLSKLLPGKKTYGAVGYGHRTSLVRFEFDDADKSGVHAKNLLPIWTPHFNALARGLAEKEFRPNTWGDFSDRLKTIRETVFDCFVDLTSALSSIRQKIETASPLLLENPEKWDSCLILLKVDHLFPLSSVDEWGFITESLAKPNDDQALSSRYPAVTRVAGLHKAIGEYSRTVQNFMNQAPHGLVMLHLIKAAKNDEERKRAIAIAKQNGISEEFVRLSMLNGCEACRAVDALQLECANFPDTALNTGSTKSFAIREKQAFLQTVDAWCRFTKCLPPRPPLMTRKRKVKKAKAPEPLSWVLGPIRTSIATQLRSLKKQKIRARILSEKLEWDGKPALWISLDVDHPCALPAALEQVWIALQAAFTPFRSQVPESLVLHHFWSQIVVLPLVAGRSLDQQCCPHFGGTIYATKESLEDNAWIFFREAIPSDTWISLDLQKWPLPREVTLLERSISDYVLLFRHVDHLADLTRCESDIDDLGMEIFQEYYTYEMERAQPDMQAVLDSLTAVLDTLNVIPREHADERPNLDACLGALVEAGKAVPPTPDFHGEAALALDQTRDWRDRLLSGMQDIGAAKLFLLADTLGFPEFQDV